MSADGLYRAVRRLTAGDDAVLADEKLSDQELSLLTHLREEFAGGIRAFEAGALFAVMCYISDRLSEKARAECDPSSWLDSLVPRFVDDPPISDGFDGKEMGTFSPEVFAPPPVGQGPHARLGAVSEVIGDLLLEPQHFAAFRHDPADYARARLHDQRSMEMIASLDPADLRRAGNHSARFLAQFDSGRDGEAQPGHVLRAAQPGPKGTPLRPLARPPARRPLVGCAWRPELMPAIFNDMYLVDIWECYIEAFCGDDLGRSGARAVAAIAAAAPVTLHSLSLSLAAPTCLQNRGWLAVARRLVRASGVKHLGDHVGLQILGSGRRVPHFVPVWRTEEQLDLLASNVAAVQEIIGVRLLLENTTSMIDFGGELGTAEFISEVARRTGCGILLDLENLRVNATNHLIDPARELADFELGAVVEVHVAGARRRPDEKWALDSHDAQIDDVVYEWLDQILPLMPACEAIILERDQRFVVAHDVPRDLRMLHALVGVRTGDRQPRQPSLS